MLDAKIASALNQITRIPSSRSRSASRSTKHKTRTGFYEEDRSLSWSTTTFEWLALMTQYCAMSIYSLWLFAKIMFRNSIQDGTKFCYLCQRLHQMISWKVCTYWGIRESDQLKFVFELCDMEIHQKTSVLNYQKLKTMVKRTIYRSETSITKLWRQAWKNWIRSSDEESKGNHWRWRRKRYLLRVERKRPVFSRRPLQFPLRDPRSCAKTRTHCRHTLWANRITRSEVCRGREVSEAKVTIGPFFDSRADIVWKVPARERLVNIGVRVPLLWKWNGL